LLLQQLAEAYYATPPAVAYRHRDCGATASMLWDLVRSQTIEYRAEGDEGVSVTDIYYCKRCGQRLGYLEAEVRELLLNPAYKKWNAKRRQQINNLKASLLKQGFKIDDSREGATYYSCPQHGAFVEISPYGEGLYEVKAGWHRLHDGRIESRHVEPCECVKLAVKVKAVFR